VHVALVIDGDGRARGVGRRDVGHVLDDPGAPDFPGGVAHRAADGLHVADVGQAAGVDGDVGPPARVAVGIDHLKDPGADRGAAGHLQLAVAGVAVGDPRPPLGIDGDGGVVPDVAGPGVDLLDDPLRAVLPGHPQIALRPGRDAVADLVADPGPSVLVDGDVRPSTGQGVAGGEVRQVGVLEQPPEPVLVAQVHQEEVRR
jgi:hypothetical protein